MRHLLLLLSFCLGGAAAQELEAGHETAVDWAETEDQMLVYLPTNYDAEKRWPVLLYYHGTNGKPRTRYLRHYTEEKDWIVIGMSYRVRGLLTLKGEEHMADYTRKELAQYHKVRTALEKHVSIDPKRIYLGGLSKGGWITSLLGNAEPQSFAGFIMLMGGRQRHLPASPNPAGFKDKPYFIGVGEEDNNYVFSRLAEAWFGRLGAVTTFRGYPDLGHDLPQEMPALRHWMQLEVDPEGMAEQANPWLEKAVAGADAQPTAMEKFDAYKQIHEDPRRRATSDESQAALRDTLNELVAATPAVRQRVEAERRFKNLMVQEMKIKTLAQMRHVRDGYAALIGPLKDTDFATVVRNAHRRVDKALAASIKATREANQ